MKIDTKHWMQAHRKRLMVSASGATDTYGPRPLRVLQVVGSLKRGGGIESWLMNVFRHNDRDKVIFDLCYTGPEPGDLAGKVREYGVSLVGCRMSLNYYPFIHRFRRMLERKSYDAVHMHHANFSGPGIHAARLARVPVRIAHYHRNREAHKNDRKRQLYLRPLRQWIVHDATHILGTSWSALEAFFPNLFSTKDPRLKVVRCGIDVSRFGGCAQQAAVRRELGLREEDRIVGHIGRFHPDKNHLGFVRIAQRVARQMPDVKFLLVGEGDLLPEVRKRVVEARLAHAFIFAGYREDIPRLLSAMDVFLFPSLCEGFGIAIVEAQAAGVPVVVADIPGASEAVAGACRSLMFPPEREDIAAKNVVSILRDPVGSRRMMEGVRTELGQFSIQRSLSDLYSVYSESRREKPECSGKQT